MLYQKTDFENSPARTKGRLPWWLEASGTGRIGSAGRISRADGNGSWGAEKNERGGCRAAVCRRLRVEHAASGEGMNRADGEDIASG